MPPSFQRGQRESIPTLREIIAYQAYDDSWVPDILAGRTMDEVGKDKFKADPLGDDPNGNFAAIVEKAVAAARAVTDLERTVHLSFGDFTTRECFYQTNRFLGRRARATARAIRPAVTRPAGRWRGACPVCGGRWGWVLRGPLPCARRVMLRSLM